MDKEYRLQFCQVCTKRTYSGQHGMICNLTNEKAVFENLCKDFTEDTAEKLNLQKENEQNIKSAIYEGTFGLSVIGIKSGITAGILLIAIGLATIFATVLLFGVLSLWSFLIIIFGIFALINGKSIQKKKIKHNPDTIGTDF